MNTMETMSAARVLYIEDLAQRLKMTVKTIRTYTGNSKYAHRIPKPFKLPGSRRLCWLEADIEAWIAAGYAAPLPEKRTRGRPTMIEQDRRANQADSSC